MKTQHWIYLLILIVILTIIVGFFSSLSKKATTSPVTSQPLTTSTTVQEINQTLFNEYFSELTTAKIPSDVKEGEEPQPIKTQIYTTKDQLCLIGVANKDIPVNTIATKFYSRDPEYLIGEIPFGLEVRQGNFSTCNNTPLPIGKYSLKIFIGDDLISVLPFDIIE